jgi:hypothetical protein
MEIRCSDERFSRWALVSVIAGMCAAIIGLPDKAHASPYSTQFQSPSGDITCSVVNAPPTDQRSLGKNFAQCDIVNQTWVPPRPPPGGRANATATLVLMRGQPPVVGYSPGALAATEPVSYDQPVTAGTIGCDSDQSTVKCIDASTGHFFRVSRESYELG